MNYGLQTTVEIDGKDIPIRTDFRVILDILEAINDPELDQADKAMAILEMFYPDLDEITDFEEALAQCFVFIDGGKTEEKKKKSPRLMDWQHDWDHIIAPVNRVLGYEARAVPLDEETGTGLHWWTFMAAYMEIGPDCTMSQIVSIRDKLAKHKKLEKQEREWYRRNRSMIDLPTNLTKDEDDLIKEWT